MNFDQWALWKRALVLNLLGAIAVVIGFASSDAKLSLKFYVAIALITLAFLNFMFLVVRPRILAARASGRQ